MLAAIEWTPILAAATAGLLALTGTVWQSRKTRTLNTNEHSENAAKLERIESKIDLNADHIERVSDRLNEHVTAHAPYRRRWFDR
jgi:Flp pilus assembly protein TadB